ncbi:ribbon-helix-helix protein, CopG family [Sphingomonas sp. JC676]|uniref:ribbon-helix-helix domain-containing protein n=1 Tax=Sphingomonas sp. JC676 TaxID=2768065 RepID=UPI0016576C25|nr:CopG family transcriptional regulator [Sphingomonas sp. JC676]MBC9030838.1 ribbon-helix-helix protein, CopG family [Sphingomonas sp. JC676]
MKPRHHLYLDEALSEQLDALAAKPGGSKSAIVADALRGYFARRGAREIDDMLKVRLDRISHQLTRIERDGHILLESLALFVRYQLNVTPPLPESDKTGRAVGRDRFLKFASQVGRHIADGRRSFEPQAAEASE